MKLGRNFDKVRRMLDERGPARRALYEARHDRRMGNHVDIRRPPRERTRHGLVRKHPTIAEYRGPHRQCTSPKPIAAIPMASRQMSSNAQSSRDMTVVRTASE
ncbi:hypothetical protein WL92_12115 [Burkholderia multivorans]|nr:hypothetical protein WL91_11265 [Burkholderia multivorans]KWF79860.1 hypothetical protein WL92_12115 [Burkholderia multivorans]